EKYGLRADQYADYAALRGDPSDNLPGIPGVGEKTAAKWLVQYQDLKNLLAHADDITGKVGESLRAAAAQVRLNRELTQLHDEVDVPTSVPELALPTPDAEAVRTLFDSLQFRTLLARVPGLAGGASAGGAPSATDEPGITVVDTFDAWRDSVSPPEAGIAGVHIEGTNVAFGWANGTAVVLPLAQVVSSGSTAAAWLASNASEFCVYSAKAWCAAGPGATAVPPVLDVCAAAYVLAAGQAVPSLPDAARIWAGMDLTAEQAQESLFADEGADVEKTAACAVALARIADTLNARLAEHEALDLVRDMEIPVAAVLAEMESTGIAVDLSALRNLEAQFAEASTKVEATAHEIAKTEFNLSSPKQLQEILFGVRGLPHTKRIKTGFSTDVEALTWLAETTKDPLPQVLLQYREVSRLRQTITGLIASVREDGRIHTTFQQFVAATGRLSSTEPNLQNIPVRTADGQRIRAAFVPGPGFESLLTADYSQIELRLMAHLSDDAGLREAFAAGEDIHTTVASGVFGVALTEVDAAMRRQVKAMSYGLAYGLSPFGLAQQLRIEPAEARQLMDDYFGRFRGVQAYLADVVAQARQVGYTQTLFGRRRYLPDLTSDNRQRRDIAERMALNAPIQGTAADIMKIAMLRCHAQLRGMASRLVLQVHDELVIEVAPGEQDAVERIVRHAMEHAASLSVPLDVNIGVGPNWDAAAH
ncbi:MAG: DNA polymerase I, partial [Actinomycetales bacterium]|nr:DNA polymerase I [Actinomycetales bacterium]